MKRRDLLRFLGIGGAAALLAGQGRAAAADQYSVIKNDLEWKNRLSPQAYKVMREHGTEPAFSSPLNAEHRTGSFNCAGCGNVLFLSDAKFDSGTGWPSFYQPADNQAVGTSTDYKLLYPRVEVHCADCGGHLGHVFEDGPEPTCLRYCMNGVALQFKPDKA